MNDDLPPDESASEAADARRDEHVASLLEVPPLDDVTRQRLVTRALTGAEQRRARVPRVLWPAAAALVVLILVGVGVFVLVNRSGDDGGTAARSTPAAPDTRQSEPHAGEADASLADLGDLGDLTDEAELRRQLAVARRDPSPTERGAAPACLDRAAVGNPAPEAFATGTHGGRPVLVLVLPSSGDSTTAVLLDLETCRAVSVVNLS